MAALVFRCRKSFPVEVCAVAPVVTETVIVRLSVFTCELPPLPVTTSSADVFPACWVRTISYVPVSRYPRLYAPAASVVVVASVLPLCLSETVHPERGRRSLLVPVLASRSRYACPRIWLYGKLSW